MLWLRITAWLHHLPFFERFVQCPKIGQYWPKLSFCVTWRILGKSVRSVYSSAFIPDSKASSRASIQESSPSRYVQTVKSFWQAYSEKTSSDNFRQNQAHDCTWSGAISHDPLRLNQHWGKAWSERTWNFGNTWQRSSLGWHLCRTKLPRNFFDSRPYKILRYETSQNILSLAISNTLASTVPKHFHRVPNSNQYISHNENLQAWPREDFGDKTMPHCDFRVGRKNR